MRPLFTLAHTVGLLMLGYAAGVLLTPTGGVMNWLVDNTLFTPPVVAALFAGCGAYVLIANPRLALISLLTTPILLYGLAAVFYFASNPSGSVTGVLSHNGLWLLTQAALLDAARRGPPLLPLPEGEPWNHS
jgi:hypothetical protein